MSKLMVLCLSLCLVACNKDKKEEASIVGTWRQVKADMVWTEGGAVRTDGRVFTDERFFMFNEDRTFKETGGAEVAGTWQREGKDIVRVTYSQSSFVAYTIKKLTNDELVLMARSESDNEYDETTYYCNRVHP